MDEGPLIAVVDDVLEVEDICVTQENRFDAAVAQLFAQLCSPVKDTPKGGEHGKRLEREGERVLEDIPVDNLSLSKRKEKLAVRKRNTLKMKGHGTV